MAVSLSLTDYQVMSALAAFLRDIMPRDIEIVLSQDNRVPEPRAKDWIELTPLFRVRMNTNINTFGDCALIGSTSDNVLTVASVSLGTIIAGAPLFGENVLPNTTIQCQITNAGGPLGGPGTYQISCAPLVPLNAASLFAGTATKEQSTRVTVQVDVHGPCSADNVQIIATLFRDYYACRFFDETGLGVAPLYADQAHQMPFMNAESQYERRWSMDLHMQANQMVITPQQFFTQFVTNIFQLPAKS